jgi:hypothetical protein
VANAAGSIDYTNVKIMNRNRAIRSCGGRYYRVVGILVLKGLF